VLVVLGANNCVPHVPRMMMQILRTARVEQMPISQIYIVIRSRKIQAFPNMQGLTDLIRTIPLGDADEPEDIFASAPGVYPPASSHLVLDASHVQRQPFADPCAGILFTDDYRVEHGDPGSTVIYTSKRFGEVELKTADPDSEDDRRLFSHYLWNAGLLMAERVSGQRLADDQERQRWDVQGQSILELGAGGHHSRRRRSRSQADSIR